MPVLDIHDYHRHDYRIAPSPERWVVNPDGSRTLLGSAAGVATQSLIPRHSAEHLAPEDSAKSLELGFADPGGDYQPKHMKGSKEHSSFSERVRGLMQRTGRWALSKVGVYPPQHPEIVESTHHVSANDFDGRPASPSDPDVVDIVNRRAKALRSAGIDEVANVLPEDLTWSPPEEGLPNYFSVEPPEYRQN